MRLTFLRRTAAPAAAAFALAACSGTGPSGSTSLSVALKDAPGDVKKAVVTVSEVSLQGSGGTTVLTSTPKTVDLLTLANEVTTLVAGVTVPSGTYTQLRLKVSGAYLEVEGAGGATSIYASSPTYAGLPPGAVVTGQLQMPSLAQSGLKVTMPGDQVTVNGDQQVLLIDFDVKQSFGKAAGNSGNWVMTPVIKGGDLALTGGVLVTAQRAQGVTADLTRAVALLRDANGDAVGLPLPLTDANGDGVFEAEFRFLAPAGYTVALAPGDGAAFTALATTPAAPAPVAVSSGQRATAAFTVTGVTAAP